MLEISTLVTLGQERAAGRAAGHGALLASARPWRERQRLHRVRLLVRPSRCWRSVTSALQAPQGPALSDAAPFSAVRCGLCH